MGQPFPFKETLAQTPKFFWEELGGYRAPTEEFNLKKKGEEVWNPKFKNWPNSFLGKK